MPSSQFQHKLSVNQRESAAAAMLNPVQIFWSPIGVTMPSLDTTGLVDIHDGDTPSIRMPVRMLSIDTPEVTADTAEGAT